jgi:radical SAM protein with 4Fe4S-binding SPASM domain
MFDQKNGVFIRSDIDGVDPFYNICGPELLDISITNYCEWECDFCYRKSNKQGKFMSLDDYSLIMDQAKKVGVLQVALGGGNPNQHPQFTDILRLTREHDIIPSYTTNGLGLTGEVLSATKKYCGAMAVSWYPPFVVAEEAIQKTELYRIKTNIHFLLNKNTLPVAIDLLRNHKDLLNKINAIIFLNYKPIHSPSSLCLTYEDQIDQFFELIKTSKACKIGFDSCMISYLTLMADDIALPTVDFCEAGRFSAYISEDLKFYPCSFMNDISENGVDLKSTSLSDGWRNGVEFVDIRHKLNSPGLQNYSIPACQACESYSFCHGGCQILNINRCRAS